LAIFFLLPSKKFLPITFKIQLLETSPQKQKELRQRQLDVSFSDVFSLPVHFEFFAIFSYCLHFSKFACLLKRLQRLKQEWQKKSDGTMQANIRQKLGLVWRNGRKLAKLSKTIILLLTVLPLKYFMSLLYIENCEGLFGGESNKKDTKMINLAGFVEELIEVGKGEGVCWDGRFYLFAAVEGQGASVVCARQSLTVLYNKPSTPYN
jgi:hypothetical protein